MDPITAAAISTAIGQGLVAVSQKLLEKGIVEPALEPATDELKQFILRDQRRHEKDEALRKAVETALAAAGAPTDDEDDMRRWLKQVSLDKLTAEKNDALRRQVARGILSFTDPAAGPPEDLVIALGWPRSRQDELAALLATLRHEFYTLDAWRPLIEYANEAAKLGVLNDVLSQLARLDNVFVKTEEGEALRVVLAQQELSQAEAARILENLLEQALKQAELVRRRIGIGSPSPDSIPLIPTVYAPREDLVHEQYNRLHDVTWLALVDGPGKGKTQLARAIAESFDAGHIWWITLSKYREDTAQEHLKQQLALWFVSLEPDNRPWEKYLSMGLTTLAELISETLTGNGLLVVDDVPGSLEDESLFYELASIASVFSVSGMNILTTSQRPVPPDLTLQLGDALSVQQPPNFSPGDILDMLRGVEAPERMTKDSIVSLIAGVTRGYPALVAATVYWLRQQEWTLNDKEWEALILGEPTEDIREHTRRRMVQFLNDQSKELFYRLSLLWEEFDRVLALEIAEVPPSVEFPGECLDELVGPWLNRLERDKYENSPLLKDSGKDNLPSEVQRLVHQTVAEHYFAQGNIDAAKAHSIALHLWGAGQIQDFAGFLIQFMMAAQTPAQAQYIEWTSWVIPPSMKWSDDLNLDLRIMFRAAQVRIRALAGSNAADLNADLERLLSDAGPDNSLSSIFAYMNTGPFLNEMPAEIAFSRALRGVRLLRETQFVPEEELDGEYEEIIWFPVARLEDPEEIRRFFQMIQDMADDERRRFFDTDLAVEGTVILLDRGWMVEADKPTEQQDWESISDCLDQVQEVASLPGTVPLRVALARARAVLLADYLKQPNRALEMLDAVPAVRDPDLSFLIDYTAGCILFDMGQYADALRHFDAATRTHGHAFFSFRFDTKRRAAIVRSKLSEWSNAKHHCIEAIHLAKEMPELLRYDRLELFGELAWIHWVTGNRKKACAAMYGYVKGLVEGDDLGTPRYREAFNKAGHGLGWFLSMATTGQSPLSTALGESYAPVEAGLFGLRRIKVGEYIPPTKFSKAFLTMQVGIFAEAVGLSRMAWETLKSVDLLAQDHDNNSLLEFRKTKLAPLATRFGAPAEAIALGIQATKSLAVGQRLSEHDIDTPTDAISIEDIWESMSKKERVAAERQLLYLVFGPAFTELLRADLPSDELERRLANWAEAVAVQSEALEDPKFCNNVVLFLQELVSPWNNGSLCQEDLEIPGDEPVLKILWYLVRSSLESTNLIDSLRLQTISIEYLIRCGKLGEHMLSGAGKFVHRFWLERANTRGFALNSPQLFREQLSRTSPRDGARTAVRVLRSASRAVGRSLPPNVLATFSTVDTTGGALANNNQALGERT